MTLLTLLAAVLLLTGALFGVIGAIGILRLPDFFTRAHAAGVTDTLCAGLILTGLMLLSSDLQSILKLALIFVFLLFTTPTATHALAKAAISAGRKPRLADRETRSSTR